MISSTQLCERLGVLHQRTVESPLFNPVFQLSLELSRQLESGAITLVDAASLAAELECDSLVDRANRLIRLLAPMGIDDNRAAAIERLKRTTWEEQVDQVHACLVRGAPVGQLPRVAANQG